MTVSTGFLVWVSCVTLLSGKKKKATNSCLVEIKSPGRFVLWVDLCKQPGFTSLGTFPHTTIEMTYISMKKVQFQLEVLEIYNKFKIIWQH